MLIHLGIKSAIYWLIGGGLEVMVSLLLDLYALCDGSSFCSLPVAESRAL